MSQLSFVELVQDDLVQMERLLQQRLPDQHEAIHSAIIHLLGSGGKRLRPALLLLSAHACGAGPAAAVLAAAAVEMLHTATIVHDDLIDGAMVRRGSATLNSKWSPSVTVLTGDYLFAYSASLIAQAGCLPLVQRYAETLMVICNGEVSQWFDGKSLQVGRRDYERRILAKTASLTAFCSEAGAILARASGETRKALRTYGEELGLAFQVVDDVLDFVADERTLGKPVGSDLRQGIVTLPVLLFLEAEPTHAALCQALRGDCSDSVMREAVQAVAQSAAIGQALEVAQAHAERAKAALQPVADSPYRRALLDAADFVVRRSF